MTTNTISTWGGVFNPEIFVAVIGGFFISFRMFGVPVYVYQELHQDMSIYFVEKNPVAKEISFYVGILFNWLILNLCVSRYTKIFSLLVLLSFPAIFWYSYSFFTGLFIWGWFLPLGVRVFFVGCCVFYLLYEMFKSEMVQNICAGCCTYLLVIEMFKYLWGSLQQVLCHLSKDGFA